MRTDWPDGAEVAVSLTFDVDCESAPRGRGEVHKLTTLSEGRFGATRGVPRILELLERHGVPGTFYIPGDTVERFPGACEAILAAGQGHEIGHHGHLHLRSDSVSAQAQRDEIELGLAALQRLGVKPRGYRSPSWELTPETFALLVEHGFEWDSSLMGDDRPHVHDGLLELPVHWSLDDWPHLHRDTTAPDAFLAVWLGEFESALRDNRHITYTMHPEVIGRGYRAALLDRLVSEIKARADVWFATHGDVARWVMS
jgi:peptidoglycan/xylan/chitin deacetylase (PgdA/CDA1 family)